MAGRYQQLIGDAKRNVTEIRPTDAVQEMKSDDAVIVDVREKDKWDEGHIPDAIHLNRGTIELDIEERVPDLDTTVILPSNPRSGIIWTWELPRRIFALQLL